MNIGGIGAYNGYAAQKAYGAVAKPVAKPTESMSAIDSGAEINKEAEIEAIKALKLDRKTERLAIVNIEEKNMSGDEAVISAKEEQMGGGSTSFKEMLGRALDS